MNLRATGKYAIGALALPALMTLAALPSHAQTNSASHVTVEMTKGKLSPAESKPGDMVAIKLKDDVRSNGEVVLKKGTTITGVVRNVAKSMMEIEWIVPPAQGRAVQSVSFTLQSVMQVNPVLQHRQLGQRLPEEQAIIAQRPHVDPPLLLGDVHFHQPPAGAGLAVGQAPHEVGDGILLDDLADIDADHFALRVFDVVAGRRPQVHGLEAHGHQVRLFLLIELGVVLDHPVPHLRHLVRDDP